METAVGPDTVDVAMVVETMLGEHDLQSMAEFIELLRQRTGTQRSDADLKALILKKAAVLGVVVE
ncbi:MULTISPECIES: hypothetical protein [Mesorhizobium]|uniref:Uncharacterized protein n=1 Tax=Rhizobium loti TaxID=381 RepID=A0A6M7U562_RHILI|nr:MULTISPECIES: hypothetical protein [Mesorhizobium]KRB22513.1 hypothetical protein ASE05_15000 [Mesorhizobium sp. Root172]OBQ62154.1 hypothetical protein A8145_21055 [Mesorhizobium loti]QKC71223.1 hypothetical protein EB815_20320 [Mesorhizobium loti]QKC90205.1 hypothetical protein EB230_18685 [Mesorhizobium sp. NZP2234]